MFPLECRAVALRLAIEASLLSKILRRLEIPSLELGKRIALELDLQAEDCEWFLLMLSEELRCCCLQCSASRGPSFWNR